MAGPTGETAANQGKFPAILRHCFLLLAPKLLLIKNGRMKQKLVGGLLPVLLIPTLVTSSSSRAQEPETVRPIAASMTHQVIYAAKPSPLLNTQPVEAIKVGEYQYQAKAEIDSETLAKIQTHNLGGRLAATVYLRNIPVLTFVGLSTESGNNNRESTYNAHSGSTGSTLGATEKAGSNRSQRRQSAVVDDPVGRALEIAAKLNQLFRENVDANAITVKWEKGDRYVIKVQNEALVEINQQTILPDTTKDFSADALQATNRLRRLLGNAPPLEEVVDKPKPAPKAVPAAISFLPKRESFRGWASWYGPGFHGNLSASGETYNQYELTAAHPNLPFGTRVLVTNLDNGRSVVVRINDRGPYVGDRLIDLSVAAAESLGMMDSGVAPVQLEIINSQKSKLDQQ
jgi:rare lipoprotein A